MDIDHPPDITSQAELAMESLLPARSKDKYLKIYKSFMEWKNKRKAKSLSETVLLAYFYEIAKTKKPSTLWAIYSMLKCTVIYKDGIDLKRYINLTKFLKRQSAGYKCKKSKILSGEDINRFLFEAPDDEYLAMKVALILGVAGACRSIELYNITTKDIKYHEDTATITLLDTNTKIERMLTIRGEFLAILKKYHVLRPSNTKTDRFFLCFRKGKCTKQVIGRHKIAKMPKDVATFLKLENPEFYTGHCFRRSSATFTVTEATLILRSDKFADGNIEDSENKTEITNKINENIKLEIVKSETESQQLISPQSSPQPSTSKQQ